MDTEIEMKRFFFEALEILDMRLYNDTHDSKNHWLFACDCEDCQATIKLKERYADWISNTLQPVQLN